MITWIRVNFLSNLFDPDRPENQCLTTSKQGVRRPAPYGHDSLIGQCAYRCTPRRRTSFSPGVPFAPLYLLSRTSNWSSSCHRSKRHIAHHLPHTQTDVKGRPRRSYATQVTKRPAAFVVRGLSFSGARREISPNGVAPTGRSGKTRIFNNLYHFRPQAWCKTYTLDLLTNVYEGLVGWGTNNEPVGLPAEKRINPVRPERPSTPPLAPGSQVPMVRDDR